MVNSRKLQPCCLEQVKLPNKEVDSYTKQAPTAFKAGVITYGEYADVAPFSWAELRLHFENNSPFTTAAKLVKEYEISHWGNVYVEEKYVIVHEGAQLRVSQRSAECHCCCS